MIGGRGVLSVITAAIVQLATVDLSTPKNGQHEKYPRLSPAEDQAAYPQKYYQLLL